MALTPISRDFPGFESLADMRDGGSTSHFIASTDGGQEEKSYSRGEASPTVPVRGQWHMGAATPSEVVWTARSSVVWFHQRVFDIMEAGGFTGWSTYDVELFDRAGNFVPGYSGLVVTGRAGPRDEARSERVSILRPGAVREGVVDRGLYFDEDSWDGSDIFRLPDRGYLIVTRPLQRALKDAGVKNLVFRPLPELDIPVTKRSLRPRG